MTTFTATPDGATASVLLQLNQDSPITKIVRTDANGIADVRLADGQLPSASTGTTIVSDYEASHGFNSYTAYVDEYVAATNYVPNPSFETGYSSWSLTNCTASITSSFSQMVKSGSSILQAVSDGTAAIPSVAVTSASYRVAVTPGQWLGMGAFLATETGYEVRIFINWRDSAGSTLSNTNSPWTLGSFYAGTNLQVVAQAPVGAASAGWYLQWRNPADTVNPMASGKRMWADVVEMFRGDDQAYVQTLLDQPYFDGNTPDTTEIEYAWTGTAHLSPSTRTTHVTKVGASATLNLQQPWLTVPVMPQYSEPVEFINKANYSRASTNTIHRPIGRADSVVVMGKLGDRTGSMEIYCDDYETARKLERVFERGEIVMLRQRVKGHDKYFTVTDIPVAPYSSQGEDKTNWALTVNFVEVRRPLGYLSGNLGWTFAELAASYPSFAAVTAAFEDFGALTLGDSNG